MAALEYRILSKILAEKDLRESLQAGLSEDQFKDAEARQIWRFLKKHWYSRATAKTLPSLRAVQNRWPAFRMTAMAADEDAPIKALVHDLKLTTFESDARSLASYFQELVDDDPQEAVRAMQSHLTDISRQFRQSEHMGLREVIENAQEHYASAQDGLIYGLSWPWDCLTEDTLGKRPGDFIVFYARMKQMKTWVMLACAVHDYLVNNARVLIWSREMNKEKMCLRLASILARVDYQLFKRGKLPKKVQRRAWETFSNLMDIADSPGHTSKKSNRQLILLCGRDAPKQLEEVQGYINEYQPDVAYLDSFYHLESANMHGIKQRWQRIAILSEDVKSMAEDESIPVVAIHQASRLGEKTHGNTMADMADSDVIAREADLIARIIMRRGKELHEEDYEVALERERKEREVRKANPRRGKPRIGKPKVRSTKGPDRAKEEKEDAPRIGAELAIVLPGNREGVLDAFMIHAVPGYNFDFISSDYSVDEIEEWIKHDESPRTSKASGRGKKQEEKPKLTKNTFKSWRASKDQGRSLQG
jgi:replicative DNA helicase